jgi:hypothetical protein
VHESLKNKNTQAPDISFLRVLLFRILFTLSTPFHVTDHQAANGLHDVPQIISFQKGNDWRHLRISAVKIDPKGEYINKFTPAAMRYVLQIITLFSPHLRKSYGSDIGTSITVN